MKRMSARNLENLSVCVFTAGERRSSLIRVLSYLDSLEISVLIFDSGPEPIPVPLSSRSRYMHMPNASLQDRLVSIPKFVETEYLLLSPDDDFFLPRGLNATLSYLDKNRDYSSAQGQRIGILQEAPLVWIPTYENQINLDFSENDISLRLQEMFNKMHYIYSIMRLDSYKKVVNCLRGSNSNNPNSLLGCEMIFSYILPLCGKHIILPVLFSARKVHENCSTATDFHDWIVDEADTGARVFRSNIREFYVNELGVCVSEAKEIEIALTNSTVGNKSNSAFDKPPKLQVRMFKSILNLVSWEKFLRKLVELRSVSRIGNLLILRVKYFNYFLSILASGNISLFQKDLSYLARFFKDYSKREYDDKAL